MFISRIGDLFHAGMIFLSKIYYVTVSYLYFFLLVVIFGVILPFTLMKIGVSITPKF